LLKLFSYFRSSSAYRVRIALNLKGLPHEIIPVHLLRNGGEQHQAQFVRSNPAHLVPVLQDGSFTLSQSVAIIEYLEELHPAPSLLPGDPALKAQIRALAFDIVCEIQPLNNLRVMQFLKSQCALDEAASAKWSREWLDRGLKTVESRIAAHAADYCCGPTPSLADCCLIPQVFNALRVNCDLAPFPNISRVYAKCMSSAAFQQAAPGRQIDAE